MVTTLWLTLTNPTKRMSNWPKRVPGQAPPWSRATHTPRAPGVWSQCQNHSVWEQQQHQTSAGIGDTKTEVLREAEIKTGPWGCPPSPPALL